MFATLSSPLKFGGVAIALGFATRSGIAADSVRAAFARMLAREPMEARAQAVEAHPADPLTAVVVPLRDGFPPARPNDTTNPAAESFTRMFNHQRTRAAPALLESAGSEPLIAAVVRPLLRTHQHTVAGAASAARQ